MIRDRAGAGHRGFGLREDRDRVEAQTMNDQRQLSQVAKGSDIERAETKSVAVQWRSTTNYTPGRE
jgi:hypothetical protein